MNDFSRQEVEDLKSRVDLCELMRSHGIELTKVGRNFAALCPWHDDKDASLVVNPEKQLYNCFGCEAKGDVLNFLQAQEQLSFPQAVMRLKGLAGPAGGELDSGSQAPSKSKPSTSAQGPTSCPQDDRFVGGLTRPQLLTRVVEHYRQGLAHSGKAQEYLKSRGLGDMEAWEAFGVGYCEGSLLTTLPPKGEVREALVQLGVLNSKGKEHFLGCIVVPISHPDLGFVGMYGRRLNPKAKTRHLFLPGPKRGVFNWQALRNSAGPNGAKKAVYLTEGVLDAMSVWVAGVHNVSAILGSSGLPDDLSRCLRASPVRELRLCLDADRAGSEGAESIAARVADRFTVSQVLLPAGDPNELLVREGPETLRNFLSCLKPLTEDEESGPEREVPLVETHDKGFSLAFEDLVYEVTPRPPYTGRLSVAMKGTRPDSRRRGGFRDRCDLNSARARAATLRGMSQSLGISRERAECHLMEILETAEEWVESVVESIEDAHTFKPPEVTEAQKLEAMDFLCAPDLVTQLLTDLENLGYVGEENGKILAYLIGLSRKLESPLSGIIRSQSGAGKSGLAGIVAQLVPPEDVIHYSRVSAQALAFAEKTAYKHKLLVMEERVGGEAADYYIRILQSSHVIRQAVTIKDPVTGKFKVQEIEVEGPIAYLETTTASRLNAENTSRCFEIYLDESEEQTRRIHQRQRAARSLARLGRSNRRRILEKHHNAQRLLEPVRVVIPYVELLTFPTKWLRTRRDNERFLSLIEASAFLHQHQRPRRQQVDDTGEPISYVEATWEDYRLAYELAQVVLKSTLHELSPASRQLLEVARGFQDEFTRRDVREATKWSQRRVIGALEELVDMEYVSKVTGSNGTTMRYTVLLHEGDGEPSPLQHLLHPNELKKALQAAR